MKITNKILALALAAVMLFGGMSIPASAAASYIEAVAPIYDRAEDFSEGLALVGIRDAEKGHDYYKFGFVDKTGKEVIPLKYTGAESFSEGLANVMIGDYETGYKAGFIDKTGKEVIPFKYESTQQFSEGYAAVRRDGKYGFIDKTGKEVVPFIYDEASGFTDGMARICTREGESFLYGFIDTTGKEVVPPKYYNVYPYTEGMALVKLHIGEYSWKSGFIDKTGKEVVPVKYDEANPFSDGLALVGAVDESSESGYKWGFVDKTGKEVVPPKYDYAAPFSDGMALVGNFGGKSVFGFIDTTGREIVPLTTKYDDIAPFSDGLARVNIGNKYGYIDKTGKEVIPIESNRAYSFSEGLALVRRGDHKDDFGNFIEGEEYFIDKTGKEVVMLSRQGAPQGQTGYMHIEPFSEGMAKFRIDVKVNEYGGIEYIQKYGFLSVNWTGSNENPSSWAQADVKTAVAAGLVPQSLQSKYTQATTRAEFCALAVALYENVKGTAIIGRKTFDDTNDINVEKMAGLGVVNGVGNNKFAPNDKLTREQAAVMLSRLAEVIGKPLTKKAATFADKGKISSWAIEGVGQVQAAEIMSGVGKNTFAPQDPYTREQSIVTMLRLYNAVK